MIWGCMGNKETGHLKFIERGERLNSEEYIKILEDYAFRSGLEIIGENFIL